MKNITTLYIVAVLLVVSSCSKDSGNSTNSSGESTSTGQGGSLARFTVVNDYLYTVDETSLNIFSLLNSEVKYVGKNMVGFGIETIFPFEDRLFIGSESGVFLYDISNPANPYKTSTVQHIVSCDPVVSDGDYAYVTLRNATSCRWNSGLNELQVLNVKNPDNAYVIKTLSLIEPYGLGIDSSYLFVCDKGLKMYDRLDRGNPVFIASVTGIEAYDVIVQQENSNLIVSADDGIYQYNYSSGTPVERSKINIQP